MLGDDLEWFLTLADFEHMTDAAAELAVPQSTLSRRLAKLERQVGTPLFDRHGRSLHLNERGRALRRHYAAAQRELQRGEVQVRRLMAPETGQIRFDFIHSLGSWMAPHILRDFRARYPRANVRLHQDVGTALIERIRSDEADVALCSPPSDTEELEWAVVRRQALALAVPPGHRLARRHHLDLRDAAQEDFVSTPPGYSTRKLAEQAAAEAGITLHVAYESTELATIAGLVSAGLGVAILPADDPTLAVSGATLAPLNTALHRELALVWRPENRATPTVAAFLDVAEASLAPQPKPTDNAGPPPPRC